MYFIILKKGGDFFARPALRLKAPNYWIFIMPLDLYNLVFNTLNMQVKYNGMCYKLFGVDVMLDDQLKPWLLELNNFPSLGILVLSLYA